MDREVIFNEQIPAELYVTGINGILTAFISPAPFVPEVGQKYLVVWDGTEYECVAVDGSSMIEGATFIGNAAAMGLQGNNEPFIIGGQQTSPMNVLCLFDTEPATHSVEIYKLAVTDGIVIYNPLGKPVTFGGYNKLEIHRRSGATTIFSEGDAEETTVELDFSEGDMVVKPDREKLFSKVNIPLPENFTAENIKKDVVIAGITGTAQGNKPPVLEMEETTLTFDVTSTTGVYQGEGITYILDNAAYTVTFDGVEYCCKGEYPEGLNVGVLGSIGEKNPHIPFFILFSVDGEMLINVPDNTSTEHTIGIKLVEDINSLLNMEETEIVFGEEFFYTMTLPMNKTDVPLKYIIDGAKYTVMWDGISFVCTAWSLTDALEDGTQIKVTGIGNKILTTGKPGAEPFIIVDVNGEIRIISLYEEIYGKSSDALNVSVSLNLAGSAEPVFNQPETEIFFSVGNMFGENVPVGITPVDINCIIEGASYNVVFGGEEYSCTAWKYAGPAPDGTDVEIIAIGNTILTTGVQTAEPFIIGTINGEFTIVNLYGSSSAIVGVTLDVSKDKVLENVPITLDFSAGNQTISAGEGQVVKTAILQKPETLIPENIAEGVDIAGIIGSLAAGGGGGSNIKIFTKVVSYTKSKSSTGWTSFASKAELAEAGIDFTTMKDGKYETSDGYVVYITLAKLATETFSNPVLSYSVFSTSPFSKNSSTSGYYWLNIYPASTTKPTASSFMHSGSTGIFDYVRQQVSLGLDIQGGAVGFYKTNEVSTSGNYMLTVMIIPTT